jgi:hypothetical protein
MCRLDTTAGIVDLDNEEQSSSVCGCYFMVIYLVAVG